MENLDEFAGMTAVLVANCAPPFVFFLGDDSGVSAIYLLCLVVRRTVHSNRPVQRVDSYLKSHYRNSGGDWLLGFNIKELFIVRVVIYLSNFFGKLAQMNRRNR